MSYVDKFKLENKTALVCGGLGLIGKEISIALSDAGAKVLILDIDKKGFNSSTEFYYGSNVNFINFDVRYIKKYEKK
ncbi:MAG: hypothetical protein AABY22_15165, partial [Nanoarchaeota archaeon]